MFFLLDPLPPSLGGVGVGQYKTKRTFLKHIWLAKPSEKHPTEEWGGEICTEMKLLQRKLKQKFLLSMKIEGKLYILH